MTESSVLILITDNKHFLSTEAYQTDRSGDIATYTNSKSTVSSYTSIFNTLWKQSDLYRKIKENNVELQQLSQIQKDFINLAAHELRNPIVPILNLSTILRSDITSLTKKQVDILDIILRNAKRLHNLTEVLLDTAKIESGSLSLKLERIQIGELIQEIISDFKSQRFKHGIDISMELIKTGIQDQEIVILGDRMRIAQLMANLFENAIKFMDVGKNGLVAIYIEKIRRDNSEVRISVTDNGKGISDDILPKLFSKFAKGSESGTGLGLFICKGIVEAHGGRIWANNNLNSPGATVSFTLPIAQNKLKEIE